ncbi:hypothetical protein Trydic_g16147 [Trypoxylus dichotomus]
MHGDVNQQNSIGRCSSCEECSLRITGETTPLLQTDAPRSNANYCIILSLFFILCIGVSVGIYLLIKDYEWESDAPFPVVEFFEQKNVHNVSKYENPIGKVQLIEYQLCDNINHCKQRIDQFSQQNSSATNMDSFNFFVDAKAMAYKHLGFDNYCSNCDNDTLVIALLSTNDFLSSNKQMYKIGDIIDYGIKHNKLLPCNEISVTKDVERLQILSDRLQIDINQRYNCTS